MRRGRHTFQFRKFIGSKGFILLGIVFLILLAANLTRTMSRDAKVKAEIRKMEQEVARLEIEQKRLADLRDFFQSDFFVEQESRKSLGYALPGEKVVVLEKSAVQTKTVAENQPLTNPQKWWQYFFGEKKSLYGVILRE
ncbi:MAG: septum formation initiator family protein [bacterium]|nr:septum formation initiator family protein [bacterium]